MASQDNIELSIILPIFDGADILRESLEKLRSWISARSYAIELVAVNDGSHDATYQILENFNAKLPYYKTVSWPVNRGKGFAVKEGIRLSRGNFVVFTDTDLSYGVDILDAMYKFMKTHSDVQLLYGSRAHPDSKGYEGYTNMRKLSSLLFSYLARFLVLPDIKDTQCGVKMFRAEFAALAAEKLTVERFAFDIELFMIAKENNLNLRDFPVSLFHREASSVRLARDAATMFKDMVRIKINSLLGRYKK